MKTKTRVRAGIFTTNYMRPWYGTSVGNVRPGPSARSPILHVVALPHVEGETYEKSTLARITIPNSETCTINESNPHSIQ
jgi:hypothetical protein